MAVVGTAENVLHLFHLRVEPLAEVRGEAVGEHFHGVAQPFACDAHLVQVVIVLQIACGGPIQLPQQAREQRPGQVEQHAQLRTGTRAVDGRHGFGQQPVEAEREAGVRLLQVLLSQGAVSRLEGGRGLATPLLVVVKLNVAMRRALSAYDPELLSDEARQILNHDDRLIPDGHRFAEYPMASDAGIEELVHLYRGLPERQREKLLGVVRATATALSPSDSESELRAVRSRHAS